MSFFAQSNRARLRYLLESTWAQTPTSGNPREMRIKTSKVSLKKETKMSDEIRADRMVPSIIETGAASEGEVDFEFSAGAIDDFLAAFVYGAWTKPMTRDFFEGNVAIVANNQIAISSTTDYSKYLVSGRVVKTEGFVAPANNGYHTISAVAFASGVTTVTISDTTLVAEPMSAFTKLFDANDVLVQSNAIRFGTAGAATIDSNGGNAFSSAIAAGQIVVGQKIHVDGYGYERGTVTYTAASALGDTLVINDTVRQITLEAGQSSASGNVEYAPGTGADSTAIVTANAANIAAAINGAYAAGKINVIAKAAVGVVTLVNLEHTGGTIAATGTAGAVVAFAGGNDGVRGVFTVIAASADVLTVFPAPPTDANAGNFKVIVKGSMLRNPSRAQDFIPQSFTIETGYEDVNQFFVNRGLRVSQFDLDAKAKEIVTGKVAFKGEGMTRNVNGQSLFANAPYTALVSTPGQVMSATTNVGNITKNGVPLVTALMSISINGDAALREQQAVGHKFPVGIGAGRFKLTGKFEAYFEDGELFDNFINHDTISLSWFFQDLDHQRYDITLPAIKLTEDPLSPGSIDQDVMEQISWEAQRDPATNSMIQVDRFSSTKAPSATA